MSGNVIAFPVHKVPARNRVAQPLPPVRVMFRGGWRHFENIGAAFVAIGHAVDAGSTTFIVECRTPPDETEPEHAQ